MIDFAKITKTLDGVACRYIHERESSYGERIHVFALFNDAGERYEYYNQQGNRLKWTGSKWELEQDGKWKIYEPKIVEVTRWIGLFADSKGWYHVAVAGEKQELDNYAYLDKQQHTFRFEVPND